MKIILAYSAKRPEKPEETEYSYPDEVKFVSYALQKKGHIIEPLNSWMQVENVVNRLRNFKPDLVFNLSRADGRRPEDSLYPAVFEQTGFAFTGSRSAALAVSSNRFLTRIYLREYNIALPRCRQINRAESKQIDFGGFFLPAVVRPNFERDNFSSRTICLTLDELLVEIEKMLQETDSVIVDEYFYGREISVFFIEGVAGQFLEPVETIHTEESSGVYEMLQNGEDAHSIYRCPSTLDPAAAKKLYDYSMLAVNALQLRSYARLDFKVTSDNSVFLYDVNPVPDMDGSSPLFAAAKHSGFSAEDILDLICNKAVKKIKADSAQKETSKVYKNVPLKVGLTYNIKRLDPKIHGDIEAEYDPPKTLDAIASAITTFGHTVVMLEANETLPQNLAESDVDIVFNIAEGYSGRTREAQVPALCDLCGIPHTGSDATTLAITMDKALTKDLLIRNGIATPQYQLFRSAKEKLDPNMKFPLIVKPNAEGSSKGITQNSVVYNEEMLREIVKMQIVQYQQPVLVEQYITGREFTVGLLQMDSLKVLPPLEVVFLKTDISHPVYSFEIKQEWDMDVRYDCPAQIDKKLERSLSLAAKKAFMALGCRDFARVDIKVSQEGVPYVLEVNPLPGLTPNFSDMCIIANAAGISYNDLIGIILKCAIRRLKGNAKRVVKQIPQEKLQPQDNKIPATNALL